MLDDGEDDEEKGLGGVEDADDGGGRTSYSIAQPTVYTPAKHAQTSMYNQSRRDTLVTRRRVALRVFR